MPLPAVPAAIVWTLGALGAAALTRFILKEHRRVNAELEAVRARTADGERDEKRPTLRRDPATGIYRPD